MKSAVQSLGPELGYSLFGLAILQKIGCYESPGLPAAGKGPSSAF